MFLQRLCPHCGLTRSSLELAAGEHECPRATLLAHQTRIARQELEAVELRVAEWEDDPAVAKRIAFARYLAARG
jgi:hypothetical protein